jgi:FtsP/CotA-like multicopper oxidase with cupredoxin domain
MKTSLLSLLALVASSAGSPAVRDSLATKSCKNTATSRNCWGKYSIDTNYYTTTPDSGRTVEYWLSVQEGTCNQDGYVRPCMTFNGTMPGLPIVANWGDKLVVHVANNLKSNGTAVHWHGARLHNSNEWDGVPGVTQCPIAPGESLTYEFG